MHIQDWTSFVEAYFICQIFSKIDQTQVNLVSDCCLTPTHHFFQLYHDENNFFFNEMMMRPALYNYKTLSLIFYSASSLNQKSVDRHVPHSDTLSWFRVNQSLLTLLTAVCLVEKQQIPILYFGLTWSELEPMTYCIRGDHANQRCSSLWKQYIVWDNDVWLPQQSMQRLIWTSSMLVVASVLFRNLQKTLWTYGDHGFQTCYPWPHPECSPTRYLGMHYTTIIDKPLSAIDRFSDHQSVQIKDYKIVICRFSDKPTVLSNSPKDWLACIQNYVRMDRNICCVSDIERKYSTTCISLIQSRHEHLNEK